MEDFALQCRLVSARPPNLPAASDWRHTCPSTRVFASGFFQVAVTDQLPLPLATLRLRLAGSGL